MNIHMYILVVYMVNIYIYIYICVYIYIYVMNIYSLFASCFVVHELAFSSSMVFSSTVLRTIHVGTYRKYIFWLLEWAFSSSMA